MKSKRYISFDTLNDVVRPEEDIVQKHYALIRNHYAQSVEIHSPDIDTFYNFIGNIPIYKFKNRSMNQWNIDKWIKPKEIIL